MVRPKTNELTARELAVMQVFWQAEDAVTAEQARGILAENGEILAYPTIANVVRGLAERKFLRATNKERPFKYAAIRTFEDVSKRLVGDLISRLYSGSRERMLVHLLDRRKLTAKEKAFLTELLESQED